MLVRARTGLMIPSRGEVPAHLTEEELNRLVRRYQEWFDSNPQGWRARHWIVFLTLRYTGARISEVLAIDDQRDIDFRRSEITLITLKRRKTSKRVVPVPDRLIAEIARVLAEFPKLKGNLYKLHRSTFFLNFRERCREAGIPRELAHPHVLRHTRAIELLRSGVPVSAVQQLLGHSDISTTAIYLQFSGVELKRLLQDRGLL